MRQRELLAQEDGKEAGCTGFRVSGVLGFQGVGFTVLGFQGFRFRVSGFQGLGFQGLGF